MGIINAGIFNSGLLARPHPRPGDQYNYDAAPAGVFERATRIAGVCEHFGVDLPTAAIAFADNHAAVTSVVVGLRSPTQVHELVERWERTVPEGLWDALIEQGLLDQLTS